MGKCDKHANKEELIDALAITETDRKIIQAVIESVQVTHCRDCVSKKELPDGRLFCTNPAGINRIVTEDEFCCKGER